MSKTPTTLIIMDGFGVWDERAGNAIAAARTPNLDKIFAENPGCRLSASGLDVGLPEGQMGNSEVGHTNIGAGRVVFQDLPRISRAIEDGSFFENEAYIEAMDDCKERDGALHLMGLLSDGGVHSHITHLFALLEMAKKRGLGRVYVHCFLDGRDVPPASGKGYVEKLADETDQRRKAVRLTPKGEAAIQRCVQVFEAVDQSMFEGFRPEETRQACGYLMRMLHNLRGDLPPERMNCQC